MAIPRDFSRKRQKLEFPSSPRSVLTDIDSGKDTLIERRSGKESELSSSSNLEASTVVSLAESSGSGRCPRYRMTSVCGRCWDMEDAVAIQPDFAKRSDQADGKFHFFGVYDGYGCSHVAVSCKDRMHEIVTEEMEQVVGLEEDWKGVMEWRFSRMDAEVVACPGGAKNASCRCELKSPKCDHVGSTIVVAIVASDRIVFANCSDLRAVLCRKGVPVSLSSNHKLDRPDELDRIQAAGGRVIYWDGARVLGVLAMSRAIGFQPNGQAQSHVQISL